MQNRRRFAPTIFLVLKPFSKICGIHCTKFEPFLKPIPTRNESPRHRLAKPRQPRKKKHSLHFSFGGGEISFEKGKGVFLSGFCPPSIRAVWRGEMQFGRGKAKLFLREERICFAPTDFFKTARFGFLPRRRVREECVAIFSDFFALITQKCHQIYYPHAIVFTLQYCYH